MVDKHHAENSRLHNKNPTNNWVWTNVLQIGKQFLFH
jgi:hypothetical protein